MDRPFAIEAMRSGDWPQVHEIYAEGLKSRVAAFMLKPPEWKAWDASHLAVGRLAARRGDTILGWTALSPGADA
jgi:phosphinothricin acetyltransferase